MFRSLFFACKLLMDKLLSTDMFVFNYGVLRDFTHRFFIYLGDGLSSSNWIATVFQGKHINLRVNGLFSNCGQYPLALSCASFTFYPFSLRFLDCPQSSAGYAHHNDKVLRCSRNM